MKEGKKDEGDKVVDFLLLSMVEDEEGEGRADDGMRKAKATMGSRQRITRARRRAMAGVRFGVACV